MTARRPPVSRLIDYEALTLQAMRGVPRTVLQRVADEGLPGEHHFVIEFETAAAGVVIPDHLRAKYPDRMTIVLQHQFSGLEVEDDQFRVTLAFGGIPATLTIPFASLTAFMDPAAQVALQFAPALDASTPESATDSGSEPGAEADAGTTAAEDRTDSVVSLADFRTRRGMPPPNHGDKDPA